MTPWVEHSVKKGESVAFIAGRYGVSPRTVARANELTAAETAPSAGDRLLVPRKDSDLIATLAEHRARQRGETILPLLRQEAIPKTPPRPKNIEETLAKGIEPFIRPLEGRISSPFGPRGGRLHDGIDIAAPSGTHVLAVRSGRVIFSGVFGGFGNTVTLDHGRGMVSRYSHNRKNLVKKGAWVRRGQPIAEVGRTGRSTGDHLHFSILINGRAVNPSKYLPK